MKALKSCKRHRNAVRRSRLRPRLSGCGVPVFWRKKPGRVTMLTGRRSRQAVSSPPTLKPKMSPKPELILRYMALADMPAVMTIDRLSFDIPWSESDYHYEVAE